jgi:hypothetical protein
MVSSSTLAAYPYWRPSRLLDGNLVAVLCEQERNSRRKEQSRELLGRGTVKLFALSLDLGGKGGREARPRRLSLLPARGKPGPPDPDPGSPCLLL